VVWSLPEGLLLDALYGFEAVVIGVYLGKTQFLEELNGDLLVDEVVLCDADTEVGKAEVR
jgi:hypothetical protein